MEFDAILARIQAAGIKYRSHVGGPVNMQSNKDYGGDMIYWNEPDGHQWEVLTVSYARQARMSADARRPCPSRSMNVRKIIFQI